MTNKMTNKYLEKIAMFGFSKKEKLSKVKTRLYMDVNNTVADYANPKMKGLNDSFKKTGKPLALKNGSINPEYLKHVSDGISADEDMHAEFKKHFDKHKKKLEDLGDHMLDGVDSRSYMNSYVKDSYS